MNFSKELLKIASILVGGKKQDAVKILSKNFPEDRVKDMVEMCFILDPDPKQRTSIAIAKWVANKSLDLNNPEIEDVEILLKKYWEYRELFKTSSTPPNADKDYFAILKQDPESYKTYFQFRDMFYEFQKFVEKKDLYRSLGQFKEFKIQHSFMHDGMEHTIYKVEKKDDVNKCPFFRGFPNYCVLQKDSKYWGDYGGPPYYPIVRVGETNIEFAGVVCPRVMLTETKQAFRNDKNNNMMDIELIKKIIPFLKKVVDRDILQKQIDRKYAKMGKNWNPSVFSKESKYIIELFGLNLPAEKKIDWKNPLPKLPMLKSIEKNQAIYSLYYMRNPMSGLGSPFLMNMRESENENAEESYPWFSDYDIFEESEMYPALVVTETVPSDYSVRIIMKLYPKQIQFGWDQFFIGENNEYKPNQKEFELLSDFAPVIRKFVNKKSIAEMFISKGKDLENVYDSAEIKKIFGLFGIKPKDVVKEIQIKDKSGKILFVSSDAEDMYDCFAEAAKKNIDLSGAYLENATLSKIEFDGLNLKRCHFHNVVFKETRFENCEMRGSLFTKCNFNKSRIVKCDISNSNFKDCEMEAIKFYHVTAVSCNFKKQMMAECNFFESDFSRSDMSDAVLLRSKFSRVKFRNVDFGGVEMMVSHLKESDFKKSDFTNADMKQSEIYDCDFRHSNFSYVKNVKQGITEEDRKKLLKLTVKRKISSDAQVVNYKVPFSGVLKMDRRKGSEWGMIEVDDAIRDSILDALELSDDFSPPDYEAHISVFDKEEVLKLPKKIDEEGERFKFVVENIATCTPRGWNEIDELYMVTCFSPCLEQLRAKYGFSPKMNENKHDFHITLAVKKK